MEYFVVKTDEINPDINSTEWEKANTGIIDNDCKNYFKGPKTTFKVLKGPEGISVRMHTEEKKLRSLEKEENGDIYFDSCMEFFYKPSIWDARYLNFEINPEGVMHLGIGTGRFDRILIYENRKTFDIVSNAKDGDWTLKFYIPNSFINKWYSNLAISLAENPTNIARGNFFKCAEKAEKPHASAWSKIEVEDGDFHIADFFGKIVFLN